MVPTSILLHKSFVYVSKPNHLYLFQGHFGLIPCDIISSISTCRRVDPSHFYVSEFEAANSTNAIHDDDDGMVDDDAWINPPDDEIYPEEEEEIVTLTFDENVVVAQDEVVVVVDVQ